MRQWDHATEETLRHLWTDLLVGLVRTYRGQRTKMWSRIPDVMTASARQTSRLDRWYTLTLRHLQIEQQGSAGDPSSLCSIWGRVRAAILACGADPLEVQRRAPLRITADLATAVAMQHPIALDGLLAAMVAARDQYPPPSLEVRIPPPDSLPLAWHALPPGHPSGAGFHHASQAHLAVDAYETIRWSRKAPSLGDLATLTSADKVQLGGRWKAYWMPLRLVLPAGMRLTSVQRPHGAGHPRRAARTIPKDNRNGYWGVVYAATDPEADDHPDDRGFAWRPSILMPKWAARLFLDVLSVRAERLQEITEADARAEGCASVAEFRALWDTLAPVGKRWADNPLVWVFEFRRVT